MRIKKNIFLSILSTFVIFMSFGSTLVLASDYDSVSPPSILPSAYQDAQVNLARKDANKENADDNSKENASKDANDTKASLNENISKILKVGNFGIVGTLFGPTSAVGTDNYANIQNTMSLDVAGIKNLDSSLGAGNKAMAYWQFGRALSTLQNDSVGKSTFGLTVDEAANGLTQTASNFTLLGIKLIKDYNPTPLIYALYDSSYLSNDRYAGENGNKLIKIVNENEFIRGYFKFFGDPVYLGASFTMFATFLIGFTALILSTFVSVWNGKSSAQTIRRALVRMGQVSIGLPILAYAFSNGISFTYDMLEKNTKESENVVLRQNLNVLDWYQNTSFGLPNGTSISVANGKFLFDEGTVYAINKFSAKNIVSSDGSANNAINNINNAIKKEESASDRALINRMRSIAGKNKNIASVSFRHTYGQDAVQDSFGGSTPWDTGKLISIADSLSKNKKISDKIDLNSIDYLKGSLEASGSEDRFTYTMRGTGYGISPMAAYNMMATEFNNNGFTVKSNTSQPTTVAVAMDATHKIAGKEVKQAPSLLRIIVIVALLYASIKALIKIVISGFGMLGKGSASAVVGSSAGIGMLFGSLVAFTLGLIGLSVISTILITLVDSLYAWVSSFGFDNNGDDGISGMINSALKDLPGWISWITPLFSGVGTIVLNLLMMYMLPKLMGVPVQMYADFISSIGDNLANRFARWEDRITASYGSRGGSYGGNTTLPGGSFSDRVKDTFSKDSIAKDGRNGKMFAAGAGLLAGATLSKVGLILSGESISDVANADNSEHNNEVDNKDFNDEKVDDLDINAEKSVQDVVEGNEFTDLPEDTENANVRALNEDAVSEQLDNSNPVQGDTTNITDENMISDNVDRSETSLGDEKQENLEKNDSSAKLGDEKVNMDNKENVDVNEDIGLNENVDLNQNSDVVDNDNVVSNEQVNADSNLVDDSKSVSQNIEQDDNKVSSPDTNSAVGKNKDTTVSEQTKEQDQNATSVGILGKAKNAVGNKVDKLKATKEALSKENLSRPVTNAKGEVMSAGRLGAGRMLQKLGGYASGNNHAMKQASAGVAMMAAAMLGKADKVVGIGQRAIDRRNDRLAEHGHEIKSTMSVDPQRKHYGNKADRRQSINEQARERVEKRRQYNNPTPQRSEKPEKPTKPQNKPNTNRTNNVKKPDNTPNVRKPKEMKNKD